MIYKDYADNRGAYGVFFCNAWGVTLIELMATLAIISILSTGIIPLSQVVYKRTRELELRNDLRLIRTAIDEYKQLVDEQIIPVDKGKSGYPETLEVLVEGVDLNQAVKVKKKFLRRIPPDPMTESGQWGLRSYADAPDSRIWGGQDVYDVYSLSDKTALDGSLYRDW
ncbi:type II secretion system protein [Desulfocicer vacuolatum]|nr:type II secretion system protein [Desulfocicer vacuolatum]